MERSRGNSPEPAQWEPLRPCLHCRPGVCLEVHRVVSSDLRSTPMVALALPAHLPFFANYRWSSLDFTNLHTAQSEPQVPLPVRRISRRLRRVSPLPFYSPVTPTGQLASPAGPPDSVRRRPFLPSLTQSFCLTTIAAQLSNRDPPGRATARHALPRDQHPRHRWGWQASTLSCLGAPLPSHQRGFATAGAPALSTNWRLHPDRFCGFLSSPAFPPSFRSLGWLFPCSSGGGGGGELGGGRRARGLKAC